MSRKRAEELRSRTVAAQKLLGMSLEGSVG